MRSWGPRVTRAVCDFFQGITIEPVIFLYCLGFSNSIVISPNVYYEKACKVGSVWFGTGETYSDEICDNLDNGNHTEAQNNVQNTVMSVQFVVMFIQGVPPIIFSFFAGPWSDKYGRKPVILLPLIGYCLYDIVYIVNSIFFDDLPLEFLLLEAVQDWFGGFVCMFIGAYSYISDITSEETRIFRLAIVDMLFNVAVAIGASLGARIYLATSYSAIYSIGLGFHICAILYGLIWVKESNPPTRSQSGQDVSDDDPQTMTCPSGQDFKEGVQLLRAKRPDGLRHVLILLVLLFGLYTAAENASRTVTTTYSRKRFEWDSNDEYVAWWSTYSSITQLLSLVSIGIITPILANVLKMKDLAITTIALTSSLCSTLITLCATIPGLLYLASAFGLLKDVATVGIRSALTKIVGNRNVGKMFAFVGALQALVNLASPLFNLLYIATFEWHIGFIYCLVSALTLVMIAMSSYCFWRVKQAAVLKSQLVVVNIQSQDLEVIDDEDLGTL